MSALRKILITLSVILLLVAAVGLLFFPRHVHVERSVRVNNTPRAVYGYVSDLKNFNSWSPWYDKDTSAYYEFANGTAQAGFVLRWKSENRHVGEGYMVITHLRPDSAVRLDMFFMGSREPAKAAYIIRPEQDHTVITWTLDVDAGVNPIWRIMGAWMDGMVGKDFEYGLQKLKRLLELR